MPTGYTADIEKGVSFEQFVWSCARAFGALVMMRDDARDAEIPARFEPSTYNRDGLEKAKAERERLIALYNTQADAEAEREYQEAQASYEKRLADKRALRAAYVDMLVKVKAWEPPSKDHEGLKDFMVEQIDRSIDFDCDEHYMEKPKRLTGSEWRKVRLAKADADILYHHNEYAKEVARTEQRNAWLAALRASVPYPPPPKEC